MIALSTDAWAAFGAVAAWALVLVTVAAVVVGARAASAANKTFRLEAEPRLIVRLAAAARVFARDQRCFRLASHIRATALVPVLGPGDVSAIDTTNEPIYFVGGRENAQGLRIIANGFDLFKPPIAVLQSTKSEAAELREAVRIEIKNLGRSPAIQVGMRWNIAGLMVSTTNRPTINGSALGSLGVEQKNDEATIVLDGIGPNDSAFVWIVNATGTAFDLSFKSAYQRDPINLSSLKSVPISAIATTGVFKLPANIGGHVPPDQTPPDPVPNVSGRPDSPSPA